MNKSVGRNFWVVVEEIPEVGRLLGPGEEGSYSHFGEGFRYVSLERVKGRYVWVFLADAIDRAVTKI